MAPLARRISNMLARGSVTLVNAAGKLQTLQISLLADEAKDAVEHFEPFGFTSNPHPGAEVLTAFIEGDRSHGIVLVAADRRYRLQNLLSGEVAIYDDHGGQIILSQTGIIINGGGHEITINGDINIMGNIRTTGTLSNNNHNISSTHVHSGVTTGSGQTGAPV